MSVLSISTPLATVHFSDLSDSEVAASILRSSHRRHAHPPQSHASLTQSRPGVRSIRRLLNNRASDYDTDNPLYDYDSYVSGASGDDVDVEFDPHIIDFEWHARFLEVGSEFFHSATTERLRRPGHCGEPKDRVQRRIRRIEKDRELRRAQRAKRRERRERVLAHAESVDSTVDDSDDKGVSLTVTTSPSFTSTSTSISGVEHNLIHRDNDDCIEDQLQYPGQELSSDLWLLIDRGTRARLRDMYDFDFLTRFESLLTAFKTSQHTHSHNHTDYYTVTDSSDEYLELLFRDLFVKNLAQGSLPFHLLYHANSQLISRKKSLRKQSHSSELVLLIQKRRGFVPHRASLTKHIQTHYQSSR